MKKSLEYTLLRRLGRLVDKWVLTRQSMSPARPQTKYNLHFAQFRDTKTFVPSDRLCWALTFELVLKGLMKSEYRALVAWYKGREFGCPAPETRHLNAAARHIVSECRRRNLR
jgi:hypothetical protein